MNRYAVLYLATLFVLVPLDFLFLGIVAKDFFNSQVGDMLFLAAFGDNVQAAAGSRGFGGAVTTMDVSVGSAPACGAGFSVSPSSFRLAHSRSTA